ncbi:hypothetical protein AB205_0096710, partial [Aquarana catesbeiana]
SGGMSIPPMKMVGSRLKTVQQSSGDKSSKHSKQRMEYMRIQGHQQVHVQLPGSAWSPPSAHLPGLPWSPPPTQLLVPSQKASFK